MTTFFVPIVGHNYHYYTACSGIWCLQLCRCTGHWQKTRSVSSSPFWRVGTYISFSLCNRIDCIRSLTHDINQKWVFSDDFNISLYKNGRLYYSDYYYADQSIYLINNRHHNVRLDDCCVITETSKHVHLNDCYFAIYILKKYYIVSKMIRHISQQ